MLHSPSAPAAIPASGTGALAGFESRCGCGLVIRSIFEREVARDAADHVAYMAAKAQGPRALSAHLRRGIR